jgi:tetratricopeptide repeat protein 21B
MIRVPFERIYYYWRQSLFGHVHALCSLFSKEIGHDPLFILWDALASGAEGKTSAGLSALQKVTNRVAMGLPVSVAQLSIHKMAKLQDFASIGQYESDVEQLQKSASAIAVVQAAQILWLTGDSFQATNLVNPLAAQSPPNRAAASLLGWIQLTSGDASAGRWFDVAFDERKGPEPSAIYGRAMYFANTSRWQDALQCFVQLTGIADFPEISLERAKIYCAMGNWDLALEAAAERASHCVSHIDVHLLNSVHCLTQIGDLDAARKAINSLCQVIEKVEGHNPVYTARILPTLSGLSWHDAEIVARCLQAFTPTAAEFKDNLNVCLCQAYLLLYAGKASEAKETFQAALVLANDSVRALAGLVEADLQLKLYNEAKDQLDFLEAMVDRRSAPLQFPIIRSKYSRAVSIPVDGREILEGMIRHLSRFSRSAMNADNAATLRVDRLFDMLMALDMDCFSSAVMEIMFQCNTLDHTVAMPLNGAMCDLLLITLELVPGCVPFSYYLAILAFGEERYAMATRAIQFVLTSRWGFNASQCHLLLAQIRLQMRQFDDAKAALGRAVAFDFGVRNTLRYQMISAELSEARAQFDKAIGIVADIKKSTEYATSNSNEKVNLALFLAQCYQKMGDSQKAVQVIQDAKTEWQGTTEFDRIEMFQATFLADQGDVRGGLDILEAFQPTSPHFSRAKKAAARIYLQKLKDKAAYIKCFKTLVEKEANKDNFMMLGNAYMKVNRFDEAVQSFTFALSCDPIDKMVALNLARSLMVVHQYDHAIAAYVHAIEMSGGDIHAQLEFSRSLYKLRRYDEATAISTVVLLAISPETSDWDRQSVSAEMYEVISLVEAKRGSPETSHEALKKALSLYNKLTAQGRTDIPGDSLAEIKIKAASLYQKSAELCLTRHDRGGALAAYGNALNLNPGASRILLALAHLHLEQGDGDKCREYCQQVLRIDDKCEEAALMLSEVSAADTVDELADAFQKSPTFHRTLVRLIEKCARVGELNRVPSFFDKADDSAGLAFCQGLYHVYTGSPQKALSFLSKSKKDAEWKDESLKLIFDIYSNPNRKYVWSETKPLATSKDLDAAKKILTRFNQAAVDVRAFEALLLLSQNTTESVTQALAIYEEGDGNDLRVVLGKCKCYLRLDRQRDATRHLNGIVHGQPTHSNISVFVEAFLMMAFICLKDQQIDEADKYAGKALDLDKSSGKAWELRGNVFEKKKEYRNAADAHQFAWDLSGHSDLGIGFKLALNYMRGADPVEAIKVSRAIFKIHPNYPKLKETVFLPCCAALRG